MTYEGLWVNGRPAVLAKKLVIEGDEKNSIEVLQGTPFTLDIRCLDEEGNLVEGIINDYPVMHKI